MPPPMPPLLWPPAADVLHQTACRAPAAGQQRRQVCRLQAQGGCGREELPCRPPSTHFGRHSSSPGAPSTAPSSTTPHLPLPPPPLAPPQVAFFFPGQGAQTVGMGKEVAEAVPAARQLFERASDILGYDLLAVCSEGAPRGRTCCWGAGPGACLVKAGWRAAAVRLREGADTAAVASQGASRLFWAAGSPFPQSGRGAPPFHLPPSRTPPRPPPLS